MNDRLESKHDARRIEDAADWFARLQGDELAADDLARWEQWMADPDNERAFARIERIWRTADDLSESLGFDPSAAAMDSYDGSVSVAEWLDRSHHRRASPRIAARAATWGRMAAAAVVVLCVGLLYATGDWLASPPGQFEFYETPKAEHRQITLVDGSQVTLGARSTMSVNYSDSRRAIVLERGEALFEVESDQNRPFVVVAGQGTITAVGTAFNVQRDADRVVVTVTEGTIEVAAQPRRDTSELPQAQPAVPIATVAVGERISYDAAGTLSMIEHADAEAATAWRDGRLRYRAESLKFVISDVNRYSDREIIIAEGSIENLVFTGTVFQDQVDEWLLGLEAVFPVELVETDGDTILLRNRN